MSLLEDVEARLAESRDRLVAALEAAAAGREVDVGGLPEVVDRLCQDIVKLPPKQGRPLAEALGLLIKGLDELENRLRQAKARAAGGGAGVRAQAARAYGRPQPR